MKSRTPLIVANWKMNQTVTDAIGYVTVFTHELKASGDTDIVIAAPFTTLYSLGVTLAETKIQLAAQNIFWEDGGAYTGEVSGNLLKDVGCRYAIIGHSERRSLFGETNQMIRKKIEAAYRADLIPIVCVGETWEERSAGKTWAVLETQLREGCGFLTPHPSQEFVLAYEPVWAIGTGKTATPQDANEVHSMIRHWLTVKYGSLFAGQTRILYGGSVTPATSQELFRQPEIDGGLVGGASLDPKKFADIIRSLL